jgi:protein-S-isoprenylcysteine O-methyltransferase Ste14
MSIEGLIKLALFLLLTGWLAYFSRASLRIPRSHGFYRLFAWECILGLLFLNASQWFRDPFSAAQVVSWLLLAISGVLVLHAANLLRSHGNLDRKRQDVALIGIEKTTSLVTKGAYRYIRHPLYSSLLFLTWGVFLKRPILVSGGLAAGSTAFLVLTARAEELENVRFFGAPYFEYIQQTKMFIPFIV